MVNKKIISPLLYHHHHLSFSTIPIIVSQTCLTLNSNLTLISNLAFSYPTTIKPYAVLVSPTQPNQLLNSSLCFSLFNSHCSLFFSVWQGFRSSCTGHPGAGSLSDPLSLFSSYNGFS